MVNLYLLYEFLVLYRCGTLSAASRELHISQPALSRSMQNLEEMIGAPLFDRNGNRILINENGKILAGYAQSLLDMEKEMIDHIREFDAGNRAMLFGACAVVAQKAFTDAAQRLFPDKAIRSEIGTEKELLDKLEKGIYQFIVITRPVEDERYICKPWKSEHLFVCLMPSHPLAQRKELTLSELDGSTVLTYSNGGFWNTVFKSKMPHSQFLTHDELDTLFYLMSVVEWPLFQSTPNLRTPPALNGRVTIPITDKEAHVTYYCIAKKDLEKDVLKIIERA